MQTNRRIARTRRAGGGLSGVAHAALQQARPERIAQHAGQQWPESEPDQVDDEQQQRRPQRALARPQQPLRGREGRPEVHRTEHQREQDHAEHGSVAVHGIHGERERQAHDERERGDPELVAQVVAPVAERVRQPPAEERAREPAERGHQPEPPAHLDHAHAVAAHQERRVERADAVADECAQRRGRRQVAKRGPGPQHPQHVAHRRRLVRARSRGPVGEPARRLAQRQLHHDCEQHARQPDYEECSPPAVALGDDRADQQP